ncbi:MAG TPA: VOC family protein [Anaerolineaceae bacterium]|nr:VOC family protein [Anaerolineaceae bacterium]
MNARTNTLTDTQFRIHPATRPGLVDLAVADLDRQVSFYQTVLGFKLHERTETSARLGAGGADFLRLTLQPGGRRYRGTTGLYHFAVLFPNRRELALAIARLFSIRYPNYPTDHILTKTTYLDDPEGNGIELYAESPEDGTWEFENGEYVTRRSDGTPSDGREPLDVEALFRLLKPDDRLDAPVPPETRLGHIHLHVANLQSAVHFYHDVIGFDIMGMAPAFRMAFVSAGGYHHHIGLNTWAGEGAPPPPAGSLGLRYFTIRFPDRPALDAVLERVKGSQIPVETIEEGYLLRDPSQNGVVLTV